MHILEWVVQGPQGEAAVERLFPPTLRHIREHPRAGQFVVLVEFALCCKKAGDEVSRPMGKISGIPKMGVLQLQHPPVPSAEDTSIVISSSEDSEEDTAVSVLPGLPPC